MPATDLRVAPNLASFGASGADASGFPWASLFQLRLPVGLRVSPRSAPSGFASGYSFRVAPNPLSLGAGWWLPELPRSPHPPALPSLRLRVSPNPASTAGSMMTSRFSSNFASSAYPRMNLRGESVIAYSRLTLDAFSISFRLNPRRQADMESTNFNRILHLPVRLELRFQFPARSSTEEELRPVRSVEASAKNR